MRMRKFLAVALSVAMAFGMMACSAGDDKKDKKDPSATEAPAEGGVITPEFAAGTAGEKLWKDFLETMEAKKDTAPIDVANKLVENPVIQFMAGAAEVVPGYLAGFSEEIDGFEKGAQFGPMMGSIAFAGYIFELAEDADVNAFMDTLKSAADPRWNICVAADYTQIGAYENTVYFLMYPSDMDNASGESGEAGGEGAGAGDMVDADVIDPDVEMGTWGEMLWEAFESNMNDNPAATAVEVAFNLSIHDSIQFMAGASEVMPGYLAGFSSDMDGFKSGATFGPMMGSIAFVGYVFELEEGADVEGFMTTLTANADPRWNICVEADQTVVGAYNNMVFFLMCPNSNQGE